MKAIILAAGYGSRMAPLTQDYPKSLLKIKKETILNRQIRMLRECGIREIVVATGFHSEKLRKACEKDIKFYHVPNYRTTTNLYSLGLGRKYLKDDFLLLLADVIFEKQLLEDILGDNNDFCLAVGKKVCDKEDVKVTINIDNKVITDVGKDVPIGRAFGEAIGLSKVQGRGIAVFQKFLSECQKKYPNYQWHVVFRELIKKGNKVRYVLAKTPWIGCNRPEDYQEAKKTFKEL